MLKRIQIVSIYMACFLLPVIATDAFAIEKGVASYYADKFQGRKTASGERYDRNKLTAAHRTLPIGSQIEVTNLNNKNSVIVTINDRGPYSGGRKLDLSYAAAKKLGLVASGVAPVTFDLVTAEKEDDFEKVIPIEYSAAALGVAKSEEEVIEAEEELADSEKMIDAITTGNADNTAKVSRKTHVKKSLVKSETHTASEKTVKSDNSHQKSSHKADKESKSEKTTHSDKGSQKAASHNKKIAKSAQASPKKTSKAKKAK